MSSFEAQIPDEDWQVAIGAHPYVQSTKEAIFLSFAVRESQPAAQQEVRTAERAEHQQHRKQVFDDGRPQMMLRGKENWAPPPDDVVYGYSHAAQQVSATATIDDSV